MSPEDRYYLATFFRILLFSDDFSYLLYGTKPVACADFEKPTSYYFSDVCLSPLSLKASKGLQIFKKNQHLFSSGNIIVRFSEDEEATYVLMINKKNLLNTLKEHINDFKQILGPAATVESLFTQITDRDYSFVDAVKDHDALVGILLGYGRNNAWLFHRKNTLRHKLREFKPPIKRDESLEKEFTEIVKKTTSFTNEAREYKYILKSPRIPLLHFMVDPLSLETKSLLEQYEKERKEMRRLFAKRNYVEATLEQLMDK
jgi:hypothetical protein